MTRFNPRPRAGGDTKAQRLAAGAYVSIHAPARGATGGVMDCPCCNKFQSTPPRGGRHPSGLMVQYNNAFQSTPPRGGRRWRQGMPDVPMEFQSTPPRGGRLDYKPHCHNNI